MSLDTRRAAVLDVDTGIDDAWALVYAVRSPILHVMGVTTVFGNANLDTTTRNTLSVLDLLGSDVPVFRGSERPLLREGAEPVPEYHGSNGLGDAAVPPPLRAEEPQEAAQFLVDAVRSHPHALTIITVARLTNLARALLYDPEIASLADRVVMMGGAAFCPGNVTPVAEANIWGDPEAADIVFQSGIPITMVGLDVTMQARLTRQDLERLDPAHSYTALLRHATEFYIQAYERDDPTVKGWCPLHDPLAVAVAEDPSLVTTRRFPVRVESRGQFTDGMTVVDARSSVGSVGAEVAVDLDRLRFMQTFYARVGIQGTP